MNHSDEENSESRVRALLAVELDAWTGPEEDAVGKMFDLLQSPLTWEQSLLETWDEGAFEEAPALVASGTGRHAGPRGIAPPKLASARNSAAFSAWAEGARIELSRMHPEFPGEKINEILAARWKMQTKKNKSRPDRGARNSAAAGGTSAASAVEHERTPSNRRRILTATTAQHLVPASQLSARGRASQKRTENFGIIAGDWDFFAPIELAACIA